MHTDDSGSAARDRKFAHYDSGTVESPTDHAPTRFTQVIQARMTGFARFTHSGCAKRVATYTEKPASATVRLNRDSGQGLTEASGPHKHLQLSSNIIVDLGSLYLQTHYATTPMQHRCNGNQTLQAAASFLVICELNKPGPLLRYRSTTHQSLNPKPKPSA